MRPLIGPVCIASCLGHRWDLGRGPCTHGHINLHPCESVQPPQLLLGHVLAVLGRREAPLLDLLDVLPDGPLRDGPKVGILLDKGGDSGARSTQHVVAHQHLPGSPAACADADRWGVELASDESGDLGRNAFKYNRKAPRLLERLSLAQQLQS